MFIASAVFEEPEIVRPERYLLTEFGTKPGVDDKDFRESLTFGVGRVSCHILIYLEPSFFKYKTQRICPGRHLAHNTLVRYRFLRARLDLSMTKNVMV